MSRVPALATFTSFPSLACFVVVLLSSATAAADDEGPAPAPPESALPPDPTPLQPFPPVEPSSTSPVKLTPTGYIETYYQWNFNHPSNGITNYRGFDNRHNT
ncbi:MAG: outer membrane protein, partial [Myxococcaceae bacterium]|nr:outer membrane protein [Myxococcaceae bacterium]